MIRINLLPFRLARKKENIRQQISIFFLSIVFLAAAMTWYTLEVEREIESTQARIQSVKAESARFKKKADRVTEIKRKLKILNEKLEIVASLQTRRHEQQILLEEFADRVVADRMWLSALKADANQVTLEGIALDNPTIADFMRNLEGSPLFDSVDLVQSKTEMYDENIPLKKFKLICKKVKPVAESSPKEGKK